MPVPATLAQHLRCRPRGWLYPGRFTGPCSVDHINVLIRTATGGWAPHSLRRRFATVAYYHSHDILAVSRLLGHSNVKTTMGYIGVLDDGLRELVDATAIMQQEENNLPVLPAYSGWAGEHEERQ